MATIYKVIIEGLIAVAAFYLIKQQLYNVTVVIAAAVLLVIAVEFIWNSGNLSMHGGSVTGMPPQWYKGVGGDATGMPPEWYKSTGGSTAAGIPYRLTDGVYSAKVLSSGYNEYVQPYNVDSKFLSGLSAWDKNQFDMFNADNRVQTGGWDDAATQAQSQAPAQVPSTTASAVAPPATAVASAPTHTNTPPVTGSAPATATTTAPAHDVPSDAYARQQGVLYSGDIINITADNNRYLQRNSIDSQIVFDTPVPKTGTNLSKLRVVLAKHNKGRQTPVKYNDVVYLMHNAYSNNTNVNKYIKYGDKLQSHQDGAAYRSFKLVDPANVQNMGPVNLAQPFIIKKGDVDDNLFLHIETDKSVSCTATAQTADKFTASITRMYELHDTNLCVSPNDILYP